MSAALRALPCEAWTAGAERGDAQRVAHATLPPPYLPLRCPRHQASQCIVLVHHYLDAIHDCPSHLWEAPPQEVQQPAHLDRPSVRIAITPPQCRSALGGLAMARAQVCRIVRQRRRRGQQKLRKDKGADGAAEGEEVAVEEVHEEGQQQA